MFAQLELASHDPRPAEIDSLFSASDRPDVPGWAVGVIQDGKFVYKRCYGMANVEEKISITSDETLFHLSHHSTEFTAACIALLAVRGDISLDDDIRTYVPELPDYGTTVTIRHLVHSISGIPGYGNTAEMRLTSGELGAFIDNQEILEIILQYESLSFEPGNAFDETVSQYVLLAEIVERVSGQTLREFADENIFRPLGMNHTFFKDDTTTVRNYAVDYLYKYVFNQGWIYEPFENDGYNSRYTRVDCGVRGLLTTLEDLYIWDQNYYDNKLAGGSEFIDLMLSTVKLNNGKDLVTGSAQWFTGINEDHIWGFGLYQADYKGLKAIVNWGGWKHGFQTIMLRFPEEKLTIILLANSQESSRLVNTTIAPKIADVIALLLVARDTPDNPGLDWNSDGAYSIADVVLMAQDIMNGHCPPEASVLLASAGGTIPVTRMEGLKAEDIAYLEKMLAQMNLTAEQEAAFRLSLYGNSGPANLPKVFSLAQNSPNPFNPATTISYSVPEGTSVQVTLKVYDIRGFLLRTLVDELREPGSYSVFWDGTDGTGRPVPSGIYLYRMQAGDFVQTRKMVLLK